MEYIHGTKDFQLNNTIVTIGKFDGVHCGHRLLLEDVKKSRKEGQKTVVFTFDHNPAGFLSGMGQSQIYSEEEKCQIMQQIGMDVLISYPFDKETSRMTAEKFIINVLAGQLGMKQAVVGKDCRFGYRRQGNIMLLHQFSEKYGFNVRVFDKKEAAGEVISSTRIRGLLEEGNMEAAAELLGMPYMIYGEVVRGQQLGRRLGIPTINQVPAENKLLPPKGVYVSTIGIPEEGNFYGITNLGVKPTVGSEGILAETHIFRYSGDLYGKKCKVFLWHFQRAEQKFSSVEKLKQQMEKDSKAAESYFLSRRIKNNG